MRLPSLLVLVIVTALSACKHDDPAQPMMAGLAGNWGGTYETQQAGNCSWSGQASVPATASWQVSGSTVSGTISQHYGQSSFPVSLTGTLIGSAVELSELNPNNVNCYGVSRTYFAHYNGTITGNTLTLVSLDTLCPIQGCIFRRTLQLTRQ